MTELTQEYVQLLFNYSNGEFFWKINRTANKVKGKIAGTLHHSGYYQIQINSKLYRTHRLIYLYFNGFLPDFIDHIDRNTSNNRIENLREVNASENRINSKSNKNTSSKYKGVSWYKITKKWVSQITTNKKVINLGYFKSEIDAAKAYNTAAIKYHGEFAYLNEVL